MHSQVFKRMYKARFLGVVEIDKEFAASQKGRNHRKFELPTFWLKTQWLTQIEQPAFLRQIHGWIFFCIFICFFAHGQKNIPFRSWHQNLPCPLSGLTRGPNPSLRKSFPITQIMSETVDVICRRLKKNACSDHTIAKDQWWPCQIIEGKQRRSQSFANAKGITALSANGKTFISCAPNQRGHIVVRPKELLQNWWVEVGNTFVKDNVNFSLFCRINPAVERNGHIVQPAQSSSIGSWNQISIDDFQNLPKQVGPTYHTSPT